MDIDTQIIPFDVRENLKEWKDVFPLKLLTKNTKPFIFPVFFELAIDVMEHNQLKEINTSLLSGIYDTIDASQNKRFRGLKIWQRDIFISCLTMAIKYKRFIPLIKRLPFRAGMEEGRHVFQTLRKACQTGSYPLVLYWIYIIFLNVKIEDPRYQNLILQDVLVAYFKPDSDKQLKLICQLLEMAYGLDIVRNQIIVAARQDNLKMIKSICSQQGNYISRSSIYDSCGREHTNLATYTNFFNNRGDLAGYVLYQGVCLAACQAGSISVIKHFIPTIPDIWKDNKLYSHSVAGAGKMPALEYFLQRKFMIVQMIYGAITTANIRCFGFLFLVVAKEPSKLSGLVRTFGKLIADSFLDNINLNYYIILRYLTITKLNLHMAVSSELKAAAILHDTQLIEYIKFRTQEINRMNILSRGDGAFSYNRQLPREIKSNPNDFVELEKKIGFCCDPSWVDQFDSVNTIRRAAFEMLLESVHYTKLGITRLIQARENGLPLIDLKWALGRSIEMKNIEIEKAIREELNPSPLKSTKSTHPRKRSINSIKAEGKKTTPNGQPKKKKIKLPQNH
uniref:Uncharacterized protein n=1 Tax=Pithovirus LCPAC201 TaxID=2506591 RepID=A0A481Z575_9VIRU|nr:MAG: hypothetical protein LCPAC201_03190 [Pithovirus LCPAC201]